MGLLCRFGECYEDDFMRIGRNGQPIGGGLGFDDEEDEEEEEQQQQGQGGNDGEERW
jgi:hypothetical protein